MRFLFYQNRDFLKSGTLISIRRTGDGFHPGLFSHFWENHYVFFISQNITISGGTTMRKKNYKGRCEKKSVPKCNEIFKAYDAIQNAYVDVLSSRNDIVEIRCNVPLEDMDYTSDFLCIKTSGEMLVRECLYRKLITKPMTIRLLEESRQYWLRRGVTDWGLIINEE